ncbi:MAG: FKBP-type peptidyl-prolyl cis-trans isomerase [Candidatus Cloacimonetes bacterium]|nr:FKBP-type peptidyl-prolyl cis-trans isomerase [Candidatus Cloacimonadota bacterium]MCF7814132.1 FKBP-type peptidyl-prolyl cis-trans isomerase [Candidatus Cloacimonadota bacterium]MCF7868719.1 FKBP-type peptidyl-prolyl cis-trans isomerase [Candidatus Cloacimonadota bacterium]MCF7884131.1 FKBP-type peptidyl-prolyl cis-trans isomerase [Candidatus Cloacimonadota bacterium]
MEALDLTTFEKTDSGLMYRITTEGEGNSPVKGDIVNVHYKGELEDGTKFDSSYDRNQPIEFELGVGRVIKGWDEGIALLKKGSKAIFVIPPELGYGARSVGAIPANSTLIFTVELVDFKPAPKIEEYDIEGKVVSKTDSGLEFILVEAGTGLKAAAGNTVSVHYSGYLQDGTMFDSSIKRNQPFEFTLGMGRVIKGWDEGIALMKEGDKARLIIPPDLGYGASGAGGVIPPNATLIFDVELLEVK